MSSKIRSRKMDSLSMVTVFLLSHAEFGTNDHREDASHFKNVCKYEDKLGGLVSQSK